MFERKKNEIAGILIRCCGTKGSKGVFMAMKNSIAKLLCMLPLTGMIAGCGSASGDTEAADGSAETKEYAAEEESSVTGDKPGDGDAQASENGEAQAPGDDDAQPSEDEGAYWEGPDENKWDGGPDFTSIATQFSGIFRDLTIEEAAGKYAITLVDGGKYAAYEGDIGDVIPEYKDVDLDGDRKSDVIRREGSHYVIECSSAGSFMTDDFSSSPNEGEIIEFEDLACRNIDEILIAHYTFGTGGPVVWNTSVYSYQKGKWEKYPLVDEDNNIISRELRDYIAKRSGRDYEPGLAEVRSADMTTLLLDFGYKNGPETVRDYEAEYLHRNFDPGYAADRDDYSCHGGYDFLLMMNHWPLELRGEPGDLTADLQNRLNIFLSNFSEQDYKQGGAWEASMAHFALQWERVNKGLKAVTKDGRSCYRLKHSDINDILQRYFGTNLEEGDLYRSGEDNVYGGYTVNEDGDYYYCEPAADGEMYANNAFSVVTSVEELGRDKPDEYLRVEYKVYRLAPEDYDEHGIGSAQYRLSAAEAGELADKGSLFEAYEGSAIIEHFDDEYWLLDYRRSID